MYNKDKLLEFRRKKDEAWKNDKDSPLTQAQKESFKGLSYFPPNSDFIFLLKLNKNIKDEGREVVVETTGGDKQVYLKAGEIDFAVHGKKIKAIVFEDPEALQFQYYLLFRDETTGRETYENGRMLQIPKNGDKLLIDFNYSYNPYSSYNNNWDCPITPKENVLPIEIRAGEKVFR